MEPKNKAVDLISKFGPKAELVAVEVRNSVDAVRTPYWDEVINLIKVERLKAISYTSKIQPLHYE